MKKLVKILPAFGLVLAAAFAFAFTEPVSVTTGYGAERDALNQVIFWHPVDLTNPQHDCDELVSVGCVYEQPDENSTMISPGKFTP